MELAAAASREGLERRLEDLRGELAGAHRDTLERRLEDQRNNVLAALASHGEERRRGHEALQRGHEELKGELSVSLDRHLEDVRLELQQPELERRLAQQALDLEGRLEETHRGFETKVEDWQMELQKELVQLNKRSAAELRVETRAALRSEAAAVAALDEQLWLTDQRLGQRVDEVMHMISFPPGVEPELDAAGDADGFAECGEADTRTSSSPRQG